MASANEQDDEKKQNDNVSIQESDGGFVTKDDERLEWKQGSLCLIYSRSNNKWYQGIIDNIYIDDKDNKEWFIVKYGDNKKKRIQRLSEALKPIKYSSTDYQDDDEKKEDDDDDDDDNVVYYTTDSNLSTNENSNGDEKILFGKTLKDRRSKIISSQDERIIVQCIGRIATDYGDRTAENQKLIGFGTGTVFDYDDKTNNVYVITCGHNIVERDMGEMKTPKSVEFRRMITYENKQKPKIDGRYQCIVNKNRYHENYQIGAGSCPNDLAVLTFKDDGFYKNIFKNDKNAVQLISSDSIDDEKIYEYSIYGFPINKDIHSKVSEKRMGEMWGMKAKSESIVPVDGKNIQMYVKRNDKKTMFIYNAIDSEGGQSGSAIFIDVSKDKCGILGVHTAGNREKKMRNWGVALNNDKIKWIQSVRKQ